MTAFTQSFTLSTSGLPAIPSQASNAGFTTLLMQDDFTTNTTIAPGYNFQTGYNWYWSTVTTSSCYSVNTTATAATIGDGNSGGGSGASGAGGILTLTGVANNDGADISLLQTCYNGYTSFPSGATLIQTGYIEAYLQFQGNGSSSSGWPGFIAWSMEAEVGDNVNALTVQPEHTEIDFMEAFDGSWGSALHEWAANSTSTSPLYSTNLNRVTADSNWHKYGGLFQNNGSTGTFTIYYDDVPIATGAGNIANPVPLSSGNFPAMMTQHSYPSLAAGVGWNMNVDWVRIWV